MSVKVIHQFVLVIGFVSLIHAAYSAAQHRTYLRITEQETNFLPIDILLQAIASLFMIIYSLLHVIGDFKEIRATVDLQEKSWETLSNIPSFYHFNHRGRSFSPFYVPPSRGKLDMGTE